MRKLMGAILALGMILTGFLGVAAQDAGTSYGVGLNAPATWFDERGNPLATMEVTGVDPDWSDYDPNYEPDRGYVYLAVSFTITNISEDAIMVDPYDFSMLDSEGANTSSAFVQAAEDGDTVLFEEETEVAAGESMDGIIVFTMFSSVSPAMFIWQPDSGKLVMVNLSDGAAASVGNGLGTPAVWTSERGDSIATFEVTGIVEDWQDYDEYSKPERGTTYIAVTVLLTNTSDVDLEVNPYDFSMIDSESSNLSTSYASAAEDAETELLVDAVVLAPGESTEGTLVFSMFDSVTPVGMMWQPEYGRLAIVILSEGDAPAGNSTPAGIEATPATGETGNDKPAASASGEEVAVDGETVVISDVSDNEIAEANVVSTLDGWDGYIESHAPDAGTRFVLVTIEVTTLGDFTMPMSPFDFTLVTESGEEIVSDLYLNADDAEVKITDRGSMLKADTTTTLVIPFVVADGEVPVSVIWETGQDTVEFSLVP